MESQNHGGIHIGLLEVIRNIDISKTKFSNTIRKEENY